MNINELHTKTRVDYAPSSENLRAIAQLSNNARRLRDWLAAWIKEQNEHD